MKGKRILRQCEVEVLQTETLDASEKQLIEAAEHSLKDAYAPYSGFFVGAALELANGVILTGNNQENAAYPSGLCAERVVLFFAGANYPYVAPKRMAIAARPAGGEPDREPATPCGACLQALWQYEQRFGEQLEILLKGGEEIWKVEGLKNLLPFAFEGLEIKN